MTDGLPLYFDAGEELDTFERDIRLVLAAREQLARATRYDEEFIEFRCLNALEAIRIAKLDPNGHGCVSIA